VPAWTLRRRLAEEGLTFRGLVEEVRKGLARVYVRQRHIPLSEIAFLVGYSEASAFSRAFHGWYGVSPQAYRSAQESRCGWSARER
jgi:AraC-like DNA-binding protein